MRHAVNHVPERWKKEENDPCPCYHIKSKHIHSVLTSGFNQISKTCIIIILISLDKKYIPTSTASANKEMHKRYNFTTIKVFLETE